MHPPLPLPALAVTVFVFFKSTSVCARVCPRVPQACCCTSLQSKLADATGRIGRLEELVHTLVAAVQELQPRAAFQAYVDANDSRVAALGVRAGHLEDLTSLPDELQRCECVFVEWGM